MTDRLLVKPAEAAVMLALSKRVLHRYIQTGVIPADAVVRIPGARGMRLRTDKLRDFVASLNQGATS